MKVSVKCMTVLLCSCMLYALPAEADTHINTPIQNTDVSQSISTTQETLQIPFKVHKDGMQETSVMDGYMDHPAQLILKNGKWHLQFKLQHPNWWKSFELFDNGRKLTTRVVNETAEEREVEVEIAQGTKQLTSKVHIVVPDIQYNNRYTTQIHLEKEVPPVPSKVEPVPQPKPNPHPKAQPKTQPEPEQKPIMPSPQKPQPDSKKESHVDKRNLVFKVLKNQTQQISVMDQYMVHPAKVTYQNQQAEVQMTLKNASWWKSFELFEGGRRIPIRIIKEDTQNDQRIIQFVMPKQTQMLTSKVHIVVPHLNYDNHYTTQIVFGNTGQAPEKPTSQTADSHQEHNNNQAPSQVADDKTTSVVSPEVQSADINTEEKSIRTQTTENQADSGATPSSHIIPNAGVDNAAPFITQQASTPQPIQLEQVKADNQLEVPPLPEIMPKFNRDADKKTPTKIVKTETGSDGNSEQLNKIYLGIIIALASALLIISVLYSRKDGKQSK
ncbi:hypothetical protein CD149_02085 [Staphylococcus condimenti]|uniref:NEAT domain-containing protein n=2 Tax=Staphylococcus condimenti TaxID=70255 RepID=A0A143PB82_9STAP|nr:MULTISPECIES: NEAT domain-containing protein [Staphylococcus]AMY05802.1 hypothetical protein A4G25_07650 [Staphylococcus condimenti]APR62007.1 hypothetical protein BTZ13_12665 [Staphylococcus condimenti]OFP04077.1 hypothetical protein HMPREF3007_06995 [Staphylococcus sp. HMSC065E08]PNZ62804.1 hypothetical protein CD149_02085 [Staphylococcus condimenti]QQS82396.1 NEAT domain-containing protein [Staphylococcus condimenti]